MGSGRPEIVFLYAYVPSSCTEQASSNVGWIKNDSVSVKKALLASGKENVDWSDFFEFIASKSKVQAWLVLMLKHVFL